MNGAMGLLRSLVLLLPVVALALEPGTRVLTLAPMRLSFEYPAEWKLDDSDAETLHLVQLYGPWKKRLEHPKITLFHYAKGSAYKDRAAFIKRRLNNAAPNSETLVGGMKAQVFILNFVDTFGVRSTDLHREPVQETFVLVDAPQGGFYVFNYRAAQAIYKSNYAAFEKLLATAKFPNI